MHNKNLNVWRGGAGKSLYVQRYRSPNEHKLREIQEIGSAIGFEPPKRQKGQAPKDLPVNSQRC
jgi:hypothetical protein